MTSVLHIQEHSHEFSLTLDCIIEVIGEAVIETLHTVPFLFVAFLIIELLEKFALDNVNKTLKKAGSAGPIFGSLLGSIPQCGFSVLASNLYSGGVITLGTLIAVFLATSDEAILILLNSPNAFLDVAKLVVTKVLIGIVVGYIVDFALKEKCHYCHDHDHDHEHDHHHDLCEQDHCGCEENKTVLAPTIVHTVKVFSFLLFFAIIINFAVAILGTERLEALLLTDSVFQPVLAGVVGFIPNCATSVLLTQLYLDGVLSFGSIIAGLCTNAGAGLIVLFRNKAKAKKNLIVIPILYISAVLPGIIIHIFL